MDFRRRFIFRGNAAAIGGRIVRPTDVLIDSSTASSLTVAGGRSTRRPAPPASASGSASAARATSAEGLFDDVKQQIELHLQPRRRRHLDDVHARARGRDGLVVGDKPKLTVKRLRASLNSKSPLGSGEPAIAVGKRDRDRGRGDRRLTG